MKKLGYGLLITTGLLIGPLAGAQGTPQEPATGRQTDASAQQQAGCPCGMMGGGMMGGGMMGGGMMGGGMMGGERMGQGMRGMGMSCPMHGMADVKVEQTPTGAVLRLTAKNPAQVDDVQRMAQRMQRCMSGSGAEQQGQQPAPERQQR